VPVVHARPHPVKVLIPERLRPYLGQLPSMVNADWYTGVDACIDSVPDAEVLMVDFGVPDKRIRDRRHAGIQRALEAGTALKWVATLATGVENWPFDVLRKRRLTLTNSAGMNSIPISEFVVMVLLAGLKSLPDLVRAQDRGEWLAKPPALGELHGKRALIYGYGRVGREIAARLRPFGVRVTGVRRHSTNEIGVISSTAWESHLPETDVLILSVPLTTATNRLVGPMQLSALPQGAWVVNIARGGLIDEVALIDALKTGHLGGACLDVAVEEPLDSASELWSLRNAIITPHASWASSRALERGAEIFSDNLQRYCLGEELSNRVDLRARY